ncbi:hypothetical protein [Inediibacterium massiliense]|uniref:hypothetical protein n=1 Tax=Inediibacterium massiliense TaxID=1658111 RepID=UPI0006B5D7D5|nr:hypothetical protein [Inediibacterium massiliense]
MIRIALKKQCRCGKIIDHGMKYCDECNNKVEQEKRERNKQYDKYVRKSEGNKKYDNFYHDKSWIQARNRIMQRYNRLCLYSYYIDKKIVFADCVHHIEFLKDNWDRRLDEKNLIPLSNDVHSKVHKSNKKAMQELLFGLLKRWKLEFGG